MTSICGRKITTATTDVLQSKLTLHKKSPHLSGEIIPDEKERLDRRPTQNSDAYLLLSKHTTTPIRWIRLILKAGLFEQPLSSIRILRCFAELSIVELVITTDPTWSAGKSAPTRTSATIAADLPRASRAQFVIITAIVTTTARSRR